MVGEDPTAGLSDAHPRSSAALGLDRREPRIDQFDHHLNGEAVSEHRRLSAAVPAGGKQFECAVPLRLEEVTRCRHMRRGLNTANSSVSLRPKRRQQ